MGPWVRCGNLLKFSLIREPTSLQIAMSPAQARNRFSSFSMHILCNSDVESYSVEPIVSAIKMRLSGRIGWGLGLDEHRTPMPTVITGSGKTILGSRSGL